MQIKQEKKEAAPVQIKRERGATPPAAPVIVKREPGRVRPALPSSPPPKPLPPWAVRPEIVVTRKPEEPGGRDAVETVRIVPAVPERAAPWSRPDAIPAPALAPGDPGTTPLPPVPPQETIPDSEEKWKRKQAHAGAAAGPIIPQDREYKYPLLQAANYAAVDPKGKVYGLIDAGLSDAGTRALIMHVRKKLRSYPVFEKIRPGELLPASSRSRRGGTTLLRVRYTTPTRYYTPGSKVSCMTVGVDEADWQSLVAKAHRI